MTLKQLINFDVLSFDRICEKIRNGEHFSLARYGDGEFNAILGKQGANCDGHVYFPAMGEDLADVLCSKPEYFVGLHQNNRNGLQEQTIEWIEGNELLGLNWVSNAVFHDAVRDGLMGQFWEACNHAVEVVVIGPDYLKHQTALGVSGYIDVPGQNTYSYLGWIKRKLNDFKDNYGLEGAVVLICASMTAPLIVDYLYHQYGNTATFIDFGSTFDPYCGVKSRSFHKNVTL